MLFVLVGLIAWLVAAFVVTYRQSRIATPVRPTTTTTAQQAADQQYGQDCANYSPTKPDLAWFYTANDGNAEGNQDLLGPGSYGSVGTGSNQVSCPPAWVQSIATIPQLEVAWYGHACGNYAPTTQQVQYFFKYLHTCPKS